MSTTADKLREHVRRRYAESALAVTEGSKGSCGSGSCCADGESEAATVGETLYDAEQRGELPGRRRAGVARMRQPDRGRGDQRG